MAPEAAASAAPAVPPFSFVLFDANGHALRPDASGMLAVTPGTLYYARLPDDVYAHYIDPKAAAFDVRP